MYGASRRFKQASRDRSSALSGPPPRGQARRGPVSGRGYEQFSSAAVDCAADTSWSADCVMLLTASETDASLGTFFTADSKLFQALSRSPVGAFWTACASLCT